MTKKPTDIALSPLSSAPTGVVVAPAATTPAPKTKLTRKRKKARSEKQRATFKAYQTEKQRSRKELVIAALSDLRESKIKFQYLTDLAKEVAKRISTNNKPCSPSTLHRNSEYRDLLIRHHGTGDTKLQDPNIHTELFLAKLEISNLSKEVCRLKDHVAKSSPAAQKTKKMTTLQKENINLRDAIDTLIKHFQGIITLDPLTGDVLDSSYKNRKVLIYASNIAPS